MENLFGSLTSLLWQLIRPFLAALTPFFTGLFLAWFLHPAVHRLKPRLGIRWAITVTYTGAFFTLAAIAGGFIVLISGALPTGSLTDTAAAVLTYFQDAVQSFSTFCENHLPAFIPGTGNAEAGLQRWFSRQFSLESLAGAVTSISSLIITLFLGIIISIYLLKDQDFFFLLWEQMLSLLLPQKIHGSISEILHEINQVLSAFLKGALMDSILVALLSSVALSVLQVDFAVMIGILGGILNLIPYFGPFIGMIPAFLMAYFQGGLAKSIAAVLSLLLVQQIDSNFIYPHIVGTAIGLHPLFVLLSVSVLGYFFGLTGMILAVPAAGIAQIFIKKWAYK